jgi:hypothetical protein
MSKTVTIPTGGDNPFVVILGGVKYVYKPGETVEVPDGVALEIEEWERWHEKYYGENVPPFASPIDDITATVGQTIVVKSVDENGKPTEWEAADMASVYEAFFKVEEAVESVEYDFTDDNGNIVPLQEVEIVQHFISTNQSGADTTLKILYEDGSVGYTAVANNYANNAGNWILAVSLAKVYGKTVYALSNKNIGSNGSISYTGSFTKQGVTIPSGWGTEWGQDPQKIKGIIGMKIPGAVGANGQFYVCGVKA